MSRTKIKNEQNDGLARIIVGLFGTMQILKSRRDDELRQSAAPPDAELDQLLARFETLESDVDRRVRETKQDASLSSNVQLLLKKPTLAELSFTYDADKVPQDSALQFCAVCNHPSVNIVSEDNWEEHNDTLNTQYEQRTEVWEKYDKEKKKANDSNNTAPLFPDDPVNPGNKLRKKPRKPRNSDYLAQTVMCMCASLRCNQEGTDNGSACFVQCRLSDFSIV